MGFVVWSGLYRSVVETLRCDDDHGEFFFSNGAVVHFYFADHDEDKRIADALTPHDKPDFSYYTAVFANPGNKPSVEADAMLNAAFELQAAGVGVLCTDSCPLL